MNLSVSNKAKELDDSSGGEEGVKPREFFWDNIALFVASSIIGIAVFEAATEFIRGGDVSCYSATNLSEAQGEYINNFCAGYLPPGAYIPAFMIIHAVFITLPHYLWLNHYGGNFDFFFQLASLLKRVREEGEHSHENLVIVGQLETTFSTYGRNTIFTFYVVKLFAQLALSLAGIGFVSSFFLQDFDSNFMCPRDFNSTVNPFWPFDSHVVCVFEVLKLLHTIWMAEIGLLGLLSFSLLWALVWCFTTHSSELGAKAVALFSFQSGLAPTCYVPSLPVPDCCKTGCRWLLRCFISIPWFSNSGPRIQSDLDFLLMKLFRTDNGLGHVFREVQIEMELKTLSNDDQRRLHIHETKQRNIMTDNAYERMKDLRDREQDEQDLKWRFTKVPMKKGVYRDFQTLPNVLLTDTMRGAVLGFGQRAPHNQNAISISFGGVGYATALARVFGRVASLNFTPEYNKSDKDDVAKITEYRTYTVSLAFPENILSSQTSDINKFVEKLRTIWVHAGFNAKFSETSFMVVGPIPKEKDFNVTTVDLLFEHIYGCLEQGAVLLTLHPLEINGKNIKDSFLGYEPNKPYFLPLKHVPLMVSNKVTEWAAKKTAAPTSEAVAVQLVQPQHSDKDKLLKSNCPPTGLEYAPHQSKLTVQCGKTRMKVLFSTYYYIQSEKVSRPRMFDSSEVKTQPKDEEKMC